MIIKCRQCTDDLTLYADDYADGEEVEDDYDLCGKCIRNREKQIKIDKGYIECELCKQLKKPDKVKDILTYEKVCPISTNGYRLIKSFETILIDKPPYDRQRVSQLLKHVNVRCCNKCLTGYNGRLLQTCISNRNDDITYRRVEKRECNTYTCIYLNKDYGKPKCLINIKDYVK